MAAGEMGMGGGLRELFWSERFWLPEDREWSELEDGPQAYQMLLPIPLALILCLLRHLFEVKLARPLGLACGLPFSPPPPVPLISSAKALLGRLKSLALAEKEAKAASKTPLLDWNANLANGKRGSTRPPPRPGQGKLDKFSETAYRCTAYSLLFLYGLWATLGESWAWETEHCWLGWPRQSIAPSIVFYYMLESAFYWGLCFTIASDVKRKDAAMNTLHHLITLGLIWWSWTLNFLRIGALVMVVHDACDPLLELAKLLKYARKELIANIVFIIFIFIWLLSRLVIFPLHILRSTVLEVPRFVGGFWAYYLFNACLFLLQGLHVIWTALIYKAVSKAIRSKDSIDDCRSSSEDEEEEGSRPKRH